VAHGRTTNPSITPSVSFDTTAGTRQGTNGYPIGVCTAAFGWGRRSGDRFIS
jgi:hypothetical protein